MVNKLTSRKFWMALAAFIAGVLALFGVNASMTQQISGVILSLGAVVAYIVGEGLVDASSAGAVRCSGSTGTNVRQGPDPVEPNEDTVEKQPVSGTGEAASETGGAV